LLPLCVCGCVAFVLLTPIVGTNLADANDVVELIKEDYSSGLLRRQLSSADLDEVLRERSVAYVDTAAWHKIDDAEVAIGEAMGKVREKFHTVEEMLATASRS